MLFPMHAAADGGADFVRFMVLSTSDISKVLWLNITDDLGAKLYATFFKPSVGNSPDSCKDHDLDPGGHSIQQETAACNQMAVDLIDKPNLLSAMPPGCDIHRLQTRVSELRVALEEAVLKGSNMGVKVSSNVERWLI